MQELTRRPDLPRLLSRVETDKFEPEKYDASGGIGAMRHGAFLERADKTGRETRAAESHS